MLQKHQIEQVCFRREAALAEFPLVSHSQILKTWTTTPDTLPYPSACFIGALILLLLHTQKGDVGICCLRQAGLLDKEMVSSCELSVF